MLLYTLRIGIYKVHYIGYMVYKNSAEVDIAPAFGEITTACNVGQAKNGSWCLLKE